MRLPMRFTLRLKVLAALLLVVTAVVSVITFAMANLFHEDKHGLPEALVRSRNLCSIRLLRGTGIGPAIRHLRGFGFGPMDATQAPHRLVARSAGRERRHHHIGLGAENAGDAGAHHR